MSNLAKMIISSTPRADRYNAATPTAVYSRNASGTSGPLECECPPSNTHDIQCRWCERRSSSTGTISGSATFAGTAVAEPTLKTGDMVFENSTLFIRDALLLREFCDSIKCGDSGRIVNILKVWAFSYRGSGRGKYGYEVLHVIHNITHAWPPTVVYVARRLLSSI